MMNPQTHQNLPFPDQIQPHLANIQPNSSPFIENTMMNPQIHQNLSALPYQEQEQYTFSDQIQPNIDTIDTIATFDPFSSSPLSFTYLPYQEQQLVPPYHDAQEQQQQLVPPYHDAQEQQQQQLVQYDDHAQPYRSWEDEYVDMMDMFTDFSPTILSELFPSTPSSPTTDDDLRMRFQPTPEFIFDFLLPARLVHGRDAHELRYYKDVVMEIDLYGSGESAEEIFGGSEEKEFYFFTKLEKANGPRMKRQIQGKGTWSCKSGTHKHVMEIQGQKLKVGTRRQFKFTYEKGSNACKDDTVSYIMHEYLPSQDLLIYKANQMNIQNFDINNVERIAFCYVYRKVEKSMKPS